MRMPQLPRIPTPIVRKQLMAIAITRCPTGSEKPTLKTNLAMLHAAITERNPAVILAMNPRTPYSTT